MWTARRAYNEFRKKRRRIKYLSDHPLFILSPTPPTNSSSSLIVHEHGAEGHKGGRDGTTSGLEQKRHIIIATAGVRVYYKKLQSKDKIQWNYSRLKGTLTLGWDIDAPQSISEVKAEKNWFKLTDAPSLGR